MAKTKVFGKLALGLFTLVGLACAGNQNAARSDVPSYDVAGQQTFSGTVQEVKEYRCPVSGTLGTHLAVKTGNEILEAHVAPVTFLKQFGISYKPGDSVTIVGVRVMFDGKPAILVRDITLDGATDKFRDDRGRPVW